MDSNGFPYFRLLNELWHGTAWYGMFWYVLVKDDTLKLAEH